MNLYQELLNKKNYQLLLQDLKDKAKSKKYKLHSSPLVENLTLQWILYNQKYVIKEIVKALSSKQYQPGLAQKNIIDTQDKTREIFSQAWPDKLIELLLAKLINQKAQTAYSDNLYSFQKGKSNLTALGNLSAFLKQSFQAELPVYIFKTDITNYGASVQIDALLAKLKNILGEQDKYIWQLIKAYLSAKYQELGETKQVEGLPAGFALTPVCENIYLMDIDQLLEIDLPLYIRFGDDILLADTNSEKLLSTADTLESQLAKRNLTVKPEKTSFLTFSTKQNFKTINHFDYLGFSINSKGELFLSSRKLKELRLYFNNKLRIAYANIKSLRTTKEKSISSLINTINFHLGQEISHPYLNLIYTNCNNDAELKKLDTWIASKILTKIYDKGGSRVFKHYPYPKLRAEGLQSIRHLSHLKSKPNKKESQC